MIIINLPVDELLIVCAFLAGAATTYSGNCKFDVDSWQFIRKCEHEYEECQYRYPLAASRKVMEGFVIKGFVIFVIRWQTVAGKIWSDYEDKKCDNANDSNCDSYAQHPLEVVEYIGFDHGTCEVRLKIDVDSGRQKEQTGPYNVDNVNWRFLEVGDHSHPKAANHS